MSHSFIKYLIIYLSGSFSFLIASDNNQYFKLHNSDSTGVNFINKLNISNVSQYETLLNGSGVVASDFNNDGLVDLFFAGLDSENKLFVNIGNLKFKDDTPNSLKLNNIFTTSVVSYDIDENGYNDLIIGTLGEGIKIFLNKNFDFHEINFNYKYGKNLAISSISLTTKSNGNKLFYISTYRSNTIRNNKNLQFEFDQKNKITKIKRAYDPLSRKYFNGEQFYIKNGKIFENSVEDLIMIYDGKFKIMPSSVYFNHERMLNWGLGSIFADINNDGFDDLYVCNDLEGMDFLYMSNSAGDLKLNNSVFPGNPMFSMGVDVADINNDGLFDIFICDMLDINLERRFDKVRRNPYVNYMISYPFVNYENNRNMLYTQNQDNSFTEIANYSGVEASNWSWCPVFIDANSDGLEDIFITNGFAYDYENKYLDNNDFISDFSKGNLDDNFILNEPNILYINNGGNKFSKHFFNDNMLNIGISHGACKADLDNDGDEDLIVNNFNIINSKDNKLNQSIIYENLSKNKNLRVYVKSVAGSNLAGFTCEFIQDKFTQKKQIRAGSRYMSSDDLGASFYYDRKSDTNKLVISRNNLNLEILNPNIDDILNLKYEDFTDRKFNITKSEGDDLFFKVSKKHHKHKSNPSFGNFNSLISNSDNFINYPGLSSILSGSEQEELIFVNAGNQIHLLNKPINQKVLTGVINDFFTLKYKDRIYVFILVCNTDGENISSAVSVLEYNEPINRLLKLNEIYVNGYQKCFNWIYDRNNDNVKIITGAGAKPHSYPLGNDSYVIPYNISQNKFLVSNQYIYCRRKLVNDISLDVVNGNIFVYTAIEANNIDKYQFNNGKMHILNNDNTASGYWNSISIGDLDNDNNQDIIIGNLSSNTYLNAYKNNIYYLYDINIPNSTPIRYYVNDEKILMPGVSQNIIKTHYNDLNSDINNIGKKRYNKLNVEKLESVIISRENYSFEGIPETFNYNSLFNTKIIDIDFDGDNDIIVISGLIGTLGEMEPQVGNNIDIYMNENGLFDSKSKIESNNLFTTSVSIYYNNEVNRLNLVSANFNNNFESLDFKSGNFIEVKLLDNDLINFGLSLRLISKTKGKIYPLYKYLPKSKLTDDSSVFRLGYDENMSQLDSIEINRIDGRKEFIIIKDSVSKYIVNSNL